MKVRTIFIAISICFCVSQSMAQSKHRKSAKEKAHLVSISEMIQGKWQNMVDKSNFLIFDKNERRELGYGMKTWDKEEFVLSNKCINESSKETEFDPKENMYISCSESDMCWCIISISKTNLTLSYMPRGNILKYKRLK